MRKVPKKNYFILFLLFAVSVGIVFGIRYIYLSRDDNDYKSVMNDFITEVKLNDLEQLDTAQTVIFISDKNDSTLEEHEKGIKDILIDYDLQSFFTYLDISSKNTDVLKEFNEKYQLKLNKNALPILVVLDSGEVVNTYSNKEFSKKDIIDFLTVNGVIESD